MSGLTNEGLVIQRLNDILVSQRQKATELFQDLVPAGEAIDTSNNTTIGRLIQLAAPSTADLWEAVQQVDSAFDPEKATGLALDKVVKYGGLTRLPAQRATLQAIFTVTGNTVIPYNSAVRGLGTNLLWRTRSYLAIDNTSNCGITVAVNTAANSSVYSITYTTASGNQTISYTSDSSATQAEILNGLYAAATSSPHNLIFNVTLNTDNTLTLVKKIIYVESTFSVNSVKLGITKWMKAAEMIAETAGEVTQDVNTVTSIETPVLGWVSVYNDTAAVGGAAKETDDELRIRFRNTKYERASNILEALYSALISVEGVTQVVIYENDTNTTDSNGIPAHNFMVIVVGGSIPLLAQTIWQNKPLGIRAYSSTGVYQTVYDSQGFPHPIGVNLPSYVPIYISIDLTKTVGIYPADGDARIKDAIVKYFSDNTQIGDDVEYSRLFTPINTVVGHYVNFLKIGTSPSPTGTSNIVIAFDSLATIDPSHIVITGT